MFKEHMVYACSGWGMGTWWGLGGVLSTLLLLGLVILIFLWIVKIWKDIQKKD